SNSNIKNNGSPVMIWTLNGAVSAGIKCGVMMGDYTRTAINTSINTGTVTGVCAHVFGIGLTPKYIPSFSWGSEGVQRYEFEKALQDVQNWKAFKGKELGPEEKILLKHIFEKY
ncbi:MAG: glucose-1-phosphate thymidylyltransferase, partial [Flavisolibacter sp.]